MMVNYGPERLFKFGQRYGSFVYASVRAYPWVTRYEGV